MPLHPPLCRTLKRMTAISKVIRLSQKLRGAKSSMSTLCIVTRHSVPLPSISAYPASSCCPFMLDQWFDWLVPAMPSLVCCSPRMLKPCVGGMLFTCQFSAQKCEHRCLVHVDAEKFSSFVWNCIYGLDSAMYSFPTRARDCAFK